MVHIDFHTVDYTEFLSVIVLLCEQITRFLEAGVFTNEKTFIACVPVFGNTTPILDCTKISAQFEYLSTMLSSKHYGKQLILYQDDVPILLQDVIFSYVRGFSISLAVKSADKYNLDGNHNPTLAISKFLNPDMNLNLETAGFNRPTLINIIY